jgi:hypothetical protein
METTFKNTFMKIQRVIHGGIIILLMLCVFSCKKDIHIHGHIGNDTTIIGTKQKCDPQHSCPIGYFCDSGYCKKIGGCNCLFHPFPPGCAPECGP